MKARFFVGWKWILAVGGASSLLVAFDNPDRLSTQATNSSKTAQLAAAPSDKPEDATVTDDLAPPLEQAPGKSAPAALPATLKTFSPGMEEVVKLAQGGISEAVLLTYINNSHQPYNPTVDEILYLTDLGVADSVITALVRGNPPVPVTPTPGPATGPTVAEAPATPAPVVANVAEVPVPEVPATQTATFETEQVNINYFYSSLSPYGSWIYVNGSGYCWRPTVCATTPDWRPYGNRGRWIYTDAGWYWQSDYSWGWAAFHYGRWDYHNRHGWVWCPGSTWAPSWVTWRSYGGYAGWAPLPSSVCYDPRVGLTFRGSRFGISVDIGLRSHFYTFIPTSRFCDRQPYNHYVPANQVRSIYQNSTVINNYIRGNNNTMINEGIGRDQIARATGTEIRRVNIQSVATIAKEQGRREVLDQNHNTIAVYRPHPAVNPASNGAGPTPSTSTPAFTKHPPTNRRIEIPSGVGQNNATGNPPQKQTGNPFNSGVRTANTSTEPPALSKFPAPNRRITIPTSPNESKLTESHATVRSDVIDPASGGRTTSSGTAVKLPPADRRVLIPTTPDLNQPAKNPTPTSIARTIPAPRNPEVPSGPRMNISPNQPQTEAQGTQLRPAAPNYANNFAAPTVTPPAQSTRNTLPPATINPDTILATRSQPSISVSPEPRTPSQVIQQPRSVAPEAPRISQPVAPRPENYTPPAVRPGSESRPSQSVPAQGRISTAPPPQNQSQPANQGGSRNSSQGNPGAPGANPRSAGSDRSR